MPAMAQDAVVNIKIPDRLREVAPFGGNLFAGFCLAAAIVVWAIYTLPWSFAAELRDDTVVFAYIAQRMLAGDVLFRDVWDHKGPLIFMLNALGLWLGGGS